MHDSCLLQQLRLVGFGVLLVEGDVDGMIVAVAECHEVKGFLEIGGCLVCNIVRYLTRMMWVDMSWLLHLILY